MAINLGSSPIAEIKLGSTPVDKVFQGTTLVWPFLTTLSGIPPIVMLNALERYVYSLTQTGKCEQNGTPTPSAPKDIMCNNGALKVGRETYTTPLGRTVYGGTLDVTTGVLTVDKAMVDMGTLNWMYYSTQQRIVAQINSGKPAGANVGLDGACSVYKVVNTGYRTMPDKSILIGNNFISNLYAAMVVHDEDYTDAETFKTAVSGQTLVFPIKTPVTYQLTPQTVEMIAERSTFQSNANGNIDITYYANGVLKTVSGNPVVITDADGQNAENVTVHIEPIQSGSGTPSPTNIRPISGMTDINITRLGGVVVDGTPEVLSITAEDEYEGDIVTFDSTSSMNIAELSVDIDPIQDLHGYDAPWPAGGGKNLFGFEKWLSDNGVEYTKSGNFYTFQVAVGLFARPFVFSETDTEVTLSFESFSNGTSVKARITLLDSSNSPVRTAYADTTTVKITGTACKVRMDWQTGGAGTVTIKAPQIELGSTATSYAPYENLCPISGTTEVVVTRGGINQWDEVYQLGTYNASTGQHVSRADILCSKNMIPVIPSAVYYFKYAIGTTGGNVYYYDKDKNFISMQYNRGNKTIPVPSNCYYINISFGTVYGTTYNHDIAINYPSTDHDYHAYSGTTYPIPLGQTVYGGTLDVTTGVLTVDRAMVDMGEMAWNYNAPSQAFASVSISSQIKKTTSDDDSPNFINSIYKPIKRSQLIFGTTDKVICENTTGTIVVSDLSFNDATAFKTAMSGVQLVYELATPITIQLTPTQVELLQGENNIWSDAGAVDIVVERAAKQTASVENLLAVGDYKDEQDIISGLLTHKCGVLILDGTEGWALTQTANVYIANNLAANALKSDTTPACLCTHYKGLAPSIGAPGMGALSIKMGYGGEGGSEVARNRVYLNDTTVGSVDGLINFLKAQYAAGTPVIVVYPLATETTEQTTAQPITAHAGSNTISISPANVSNINLEVKYWTS